MEGFDSVRHLARLRHAEACAKAGGLKTAVALLGGATELTGIERQAVPDNDPVLCGAEAILEPSTPAIFYKNSVAPAQAAFYQAHEFGHHWLDSATGACSRSDIDDSMPEERVPLGNGRVEGYGPRERRECQANVFAREFLLPCSEVRRSFVEERLGAVAIAERLGVPLGLVHQQLAHALLVPEPEPVPEAAGVTPALDPSQKAVAEAEDGPNLIEAGPGTGKTRTLIARIDWLLRRGIDPASILALTFSNKAAEEMRERVAAAAPAAAPAIWAGTFHAFGLEVLRKYGDLLGLPADVRLVDPGDALLMLEERLPALRLEHYLQLYEPAFALRDILAAISRAKDELIGPGEYRALGGAMLSSASDEAEREAAEKVIEVAGRDHPRFGHARQQDIANPRRADQTWPMPAGTIMVAFGVSWCKNRRKGALHATGGRRLREAMEAAAQPIAMYKTAIGRTTLSRPIRLALIDGILTENARLFDYGCGRGDDLRILDAMGYQGSGWDPVHRPEHDTAPAPIVNLGYVVNVIENPQERRETLRRAWSLAEQVLIVSARLTGRSGQYERSGRVCRRLSNLAGHVPEAVRAARAQELDRSGARPFLFACRAGRILRIPVRGSAVRLPCVPPAPADRHSADCEAARTL